jgi:hypothetical protein
MLLLLMISLNVKAQVNYGARFIGIGNTGTALQDVYSLVRNPAGIANLKSPTASLSFEKPFLGVDIKSQSALFAFPFKLGVLGYAINNYGISNVYSDLKTGLSFARTFGPKLSLAITVNYHQLKISSYGLSKTFSIEFGAQYIVKENWIIGAHVDNPGRFGYQNQNYYVIPTLFHLGNSYQFSDQVLISIDGKYLFNESWDGSLGIEYSMIHWMKIRGGISVNHFQQHVGFGVAYQNFLFDAATTIHPRLGISPQISLSYVF